MTIDTALKICYALYHEIQPREGQAREAFRMAVEALEFRKDHPEIILCKDCEKYNPLMGHCGDGGKLCSPNSFCGDGIRRTE